MKKIIQFLFLLILSDTGYSQVVINEIYGGGGNSGSTYTNDFIELFNPGSNPVDLTGWSVQYAAVNSATWSVTVLSGILQPHHYYLIQEFTGPGGTTSLPAADATGTININAVAGKVILCNTTTAQTVAIPTTNIIDLVGYGTTADAFETAKAPAPSNTVSIQRKITGNDTNDNSVDFATSAPTPLNSSNVLPLQLVLFQAEKIGNYARINWITEQEINTNNFEIERSEEGILWSTIISVPAKNGSQRNFYTTIDNSPKHGLDYYRLKEINKDGSFEYSAVQKLLFNGNPTVSIVPNPASDFINIYFDKPVEGNCRIDLISTDGKIIVTTVSNQQQNKIATTNLAKGIYFVRINQNGTNTLVKVLVR